MKIGSFLTLEAFNLATNSTDKYRCKIIDLKSGYIYTDYPIHIQTKRTQAFRIGTRVIAEYLADDQSIHRFRTIMKDRKEGKIPTLVFEMPNENQIERIQRRQYVRVDTAVDVAIHSVGNTFKPFTTVSVDLSGGGLSVVVPKDIHLEEKEKINVNLVLKMHSGEYHYLDVTGEVVRLIQSKSTANTASIKLDKLHEKDKQLIIRYCFEKQREARKKETQ